MSYVLTDAQRREGTGIIRSMLQTWKRDANEWARIVAICAAIPSEEGIREWSSYVIGNVASLPVPKDMTNSEIERRNKEIVARFRSYTSLLALCRKEGITFGPKDSAHALRAARKAAAAKEKESLSEERKEAEALKRAASFVANIEKSGVWYAPAVQAVLALAERIEGNEETGRALAEYIAKFAPVEVAAPNVPGAAKQAAKQATRKVA